MKDLGIIVFAHTRAKRLDDMLNSLDKQCSLPFVDLWIDGYQGIVETKFKVEKLQIIANNYKIPVKRFHKGNLGFRKLILLAMQSAIHNYRDIIFLEDDCFPSHCAIDTFRSELDEIRDNNEVFSVYGHPFLMAEETGYCSRFQGWGWATTADKLKPYVQELIDLYSLPEQDYLDFVDKALTSELVERLDVTPPRQPTYTLTSFFAWDETLALLTARDRKLHKPTNKRIIFNCGIGEGSSRFNGKEIFFNPPFNIVSPDTIWDHF